MLGALSSGMLLYGASLIYGFTGTVSFAGIAAAVKTGSVGIVFGIVFLLAGLCFKVSAVPFHMWTPDVYEGAPTPVTAFFASAPKVAALAVFTRVTLTAFPGIVTQWQQIVVFVAIASMALGSFAAIGQRNIKRLMAYSSIGHMGFALVGLAAGTAEGAQGVLVYLAIYVAMTLGSFAVILAMKRNGQTVEQISDFAGLSRTNPLLAFFFAMLLFSLAGVPPLAGFFAKFYVFVAAIKAGLFTLVRHRRAHAAWSAPTTICLIVKVMYFDDPLAKLDPDARGTAHGAGDRRPLQHLLLCLSGAAGQHGHCRGEVAVLDAIHARTARRIRRLPPRCLRPDRLDQRGSDGARPRRRARPDVVRHLRADRGTRTATPALDRAARQSRQQHSGSDGGRAGGRGDAWLCRGACAGGCVAQAQRRGRAAVGGFG